MPGPSPRGLRASQSEEARGNAHTAPVWLMAQMRQIVRALAQLFPTAIVSGRGREKVKAFVKLKELYYAGSHGMDIAGPQARANRVFGRV